MKYNAFSFQTKRSCRTHWNSKKQIKDYHLDTRRAERERRVGEKMVTEWKKTTTTKELKLKTSFTQIKWAPSQSFNQQWPTNKIPLYDKKTKWKWMKQQTNRLESNLRMKPPKNTHRQTKVTHQQLTKQ